MAGRFRRFTVRALAVSILLGAITWLADWLILRYKAQNAFGQIEVHRRYAIHLKNRRIEERIEKPKLEECVHSLFPHNGDSACWYLARHADDLIDVDSGPWHFFSE